MFPFEPRGIVKMFPEPTVSKTVEFLKPLGSVARTSKKALIFPKMLTSRRVPYHCSCRTVWFHECSPRRERQLQPRMDIFLMVTSTPSHSMSLLRALTNFLFLPGPSILQTLPGPYIPPPLSLLLPSSSSSCQLFFGNNALLR